MKKVIVVGGVNIDICGQSFRPLIPEDSNPGFSKISLGGVGRNIAHNLALLKVDVSLLTALGEDANADMVEDSCANLGIDLSHAFRVPGGRTSTYIYLCGPDADMAMAVADMELCEHITPEYLSGHIDLLEQADVIVMDTNIPEASVLWLTANCSKPVFADPVSVTKSRKLQVCLGKLHTLKPNLLEASHLSGIRIDNEKDLSCAASVLLRTGLQSVFISLGSKGVFYADHNEMGTIPVIPTEVRNATGAGDAFMSGLVWSYLKGKDLRDTARLATAASSIAIEGNETINPEMSVEYLLKKASQIK